MVAITLTGDAGVTPIKKHTLRWIENHPARAELFIGAQGDCLLLTGRSVSDSCYDSERLCLMFVLELGRLKLDTAVQRWTVVHECTGRGPEIGALWYRRKKKVHPNRKASAKVSKERGSQVG